VQLGMSALGQKQTLHAKVQLFQVEGVTCAYKRYRMWPQRCCRLFFFECLSQEFSQRFNMEWLR